MVARGTRWSVWLPFILAGLIAASGGPVMAGVINGEADTEPGPLVTGALLNVATSGQTGEPPVIAELPAAVDPPLIPGSGWQYFQWGGGEPVPTTPSPWTCTLSQPYWLDVTDCYLTGDVFEVFDWGVSIGTTAWVPPTGDSTGDADFAFSDPRWSSGSFLLAPGSHEITVWAIENPWAGGGAYLRLDRQGELLIPEPTTLMVLGLGLLGVARARRRRSA